VTDLGRYPTRIFWSEEDAGFIAEAPDMPGCSAFGETQEEALTELNDAKIAWMEAAAAAGNPIPEPSVLPEVSGKFLVRMPKSLHARLSMDAAREGVSLNQFVVYLLTQHQAEHQLERSSRKESGWWWIDAAADLRPTVRYESGVRIIGRAGHDAILTTGWKTFATGTLRSWFGSERVQSAPSTTTFRELLDTSRGRA
jgi:predicted RNase H-like HicB family nuclease